MGKRPEGRTAFSDLLFPCLFSFLEEKSDPKQRGSERKSGMEIVFEPFILTKYLFRKSLSGSAERLPGLYGRLQAGNGAVFCFDE